MFPEARTTQYPNTLFQHHFPNSSKNKSSHARHARQNHSHLVHENIRSSTSIRQKRRVRASSGCSVLVRGSSCGDPHSCICRVDRARDSSCRGHGGDGRHVAGHSRRRCHARHGCAEGDAVRGAKILTICKCRCGLYQYRALGRLGSWSDIPAWSDAVQWASI